MEDAVSFSSCRLEGNLGNDWSHHVHQASPTPALCMFSCSRPLLPIDLDFAPSPVKTLDARLLHHHTHKSIHQTWGPKPQTSLSPPFRLFPSADYLSCSASFPRAPPQDLKAHFTIWRLHRRSLLSPFSRASRPASPAPGAFQHHYPASATRSDGGVQQLHNNRSEERDPHQ